VPKELTEAGKRNCDTDASTLDSRLVFFFWELL
jgi:hypothetical protein